MCPLLLFHTSVTSALLKSLTFCVPSAFLFFPTPLTSPSTPPSSHLSQVLVPLVLLQALQSEGQSLSTLLNLGLRYLEEDEAGYIIQQGGWVSHLEIKNSFCSLHV